VDHLPQQWSAQALLIQYNDTNLGCIVKCLSIHALVGQHSDPLTSKARYEVDPESIGSLSAQLTDRCGVEAELAAYLQTSRG